MGTGIKEITSKRKRRPPTRLRSRSPASSRIHMNCQQEREQEMWKW